MAQRVLSQQAQDLIELVRCALAGEKISKERLETIDLAELFALAQAQSLAALVSFALNGQISAEQMCPWKEVRDKSLRKNLLLDMERRELCGWMSQNGIWHMSLKGSVLKDLYPCMEMRQMSDQDILYDAAHRKAVFAHMLAKGYETDSHGDTHHDAFYKPPIYNMELHHKLFERCCDLKLVDYYEDVKQRLVPNSSDPLEFHFSHEDFYIYMTAHAFKHYRDKGVGLRSCVDVWVYENANPQLDWAYIGQECARLRMENFEKNCRSLAHKLFGGDAEPLSKEEWELLQFSLESDTYGTEDGGIRQSLKSIQGCDGAVAGWTKIKYLLKRLFPDLKWMQQKSKMVRKHPWTLPLAWGIRLCRGVFLKGGHTAAELRYVMDTEEI